MNTLIRSLALVAALAALATASASFSYLADGATAPWMNTVGSGGLDQSVRITMASGSYGSGGLFSKKNQTINGEEWIQLCFATADHVLRGSGLNSLTFQGAATQWNLLNGSPWLSASALGGSDGNDDLGFLGLKARRSALNAGFLAFIDGLTPLSMDTPSLDNATAYGYGRSARYLTDGSGAVIGFRWRPDLDDGSATSSYVNHRKVNIGPVTVENKAYSIYDFQAIKWNVRIANGFGGINSGDSGGVILQNNKFVGVVSYSQGITGTDAQGQYETFLPIHEQGANALNQDNIGWLQNKCMDFEAVPEPSSMIFAGIAATALLRKKKSPRD